MSRQRWVAPESTTERQKWKSPGMDSNTVQSDCSNDTGIPGSVNVIVVHDPKRKRVDDEAETSGRVMTDMEVEPHVLTDIIRAKRPKIVFLMETFLNKRRMEPIRVQLGFHNMFVVDACGHRGGLVMFWHESVEVEVTGYSSNHIDTVVTMDIGSPRWRFTGYYGYLERARRREAWQMLRNLAGLSSLPWVIMGDYNDLLYPEEKRGRHPHPNWLIAGFSEAVADSGLQDVVFKRNQFTWEKSRGTPDMIEEKLDRILATDSWLTLFEGVKACSLTCPYSDHLPLVLTPVVLSQTTRRRRFCFDNMWIREDKCREIVTNSWSRTMSLDMLGRIEVCGADLWKWGRGYNKEFQRRVDHIYWKQRAKEHWYKEGDLNSKYFHNSVRSRRRRNRISQLRRDDGVLVSSEDDMGEVMVDYFTNLFTASHGEFDEVLACITSRINPLDNVALLRPVTEEEVRQAVFQMHPDKSPGPDGLGPGFFQHFWDIVGADVTMFCRSFMTSGKLPTKANDTLIVLIPKKANPDSMKDLRPIALCNVLYKVVAKV
nr:ribonuclease H [Ipomoea batatas]